MAKPAVLNKRKFQFKVFTSIKEILDYLGIANYLHLFVDNKLSAVIDFYNIDEFRLKRMLMPVAVRNLILRYTQFYNKEVRKRAKSRRNGESKSSVKKGSRHFSPDRSQNLVDILIKNGTGSRSCSKKRKSKSRSKSKNHAQSLLSSIGTCDQTKLK